MTTAALIVAAGRGQRFGEDVPKQYAKLGGEPVLRRTAQAFLHHSGIDLVAVVINRDHEAFYSEAVGDLPLAGPVEGGATRQESVLFGLRGLAGAAPENVVVHDAARPFVSKAVIDRVLARLTPTRGAIAGVPVVDTLKREGPDVTIAGTAERGGLWRAQTPQGFPYAPLLVAHETHAGAGFSDDAAVAEASGLATGLVPGSLENIKITTRDDLAFAERLLTGMMETRTGQGFDVHRFGPGDHVMLCGVPIPHERGLAGHSDADVGLHALTDALLGALGEGDIGVHFPPSEARWRDVPSRVFVVKAAELVAAANGRVVNVDLTIICEEPRLGPYRHEMRASVAGMLRMPEGHVSIKATTTEGLGFAGRREGIAAQALAAVAVPRAEG